MKVSIIIPIYNVAPYIGRCLDSVAAQTYTGDMECILVDDCGTDDSIRIAGNWMSQYHGSIHFHITRHQVNKGLSAARNSGIAVAQGDYVYFLDGDDAITPDCIETLVCLAEKYPDVDFVQGNTIEGSGQLMDNVYDYIDVPEYCNDSNELADLILRRTNRTAWNRLTKRTFLLGNSLFFPEGLVVEDHYWAWFLARHTSAAAFTRRGTYFYYRNDSSIMNSSSHAMLIKRYTSYLKIGLAITDDIAQNQGTLSCQRMYAGETFLFALENVARIHSLRHWWRFWLAISHAQWKVFEGKTWHRTCFFMCMMPPLCFLAGFSAWRWRLRHYVLSKL